MATVKLYLDKRGCDAATPAPVKISICMNGRTALQSTGVKVLPGQWDEVAAKVISHPKRKYLNTILTSQLNDWQLALLKLSESNRTDKPSSVTELKRIILGMLHPERCKPKGGTFIKHFERFAESRRTPGSRSAYRQTLRRIRAFDMEIEQRTFEDIDKQWLTDFETFMAQTAKSANARALHFRNIRAVFNDAIDNGLTQCYPFRKFKIRREPTRKRSLSVEQLRQLITFPCELYQVQYRDMFVLMFYLIGINAVDLFNAKQDAAGNGRLEYIRSKTHKLYSIKIEPEAQALLDKYRGTKFLVNIMDTRKDYKQYLHRMGDELKKIGVTEYGKHGKKTIHPLFPKISQYWCRHTWATIAASLDIPKETIAAALGHGGNTVTDIYIDFDRRKVDNANRCVIDWVLYGKKRCR